MQDKGGDHSKRNGNRPHRDCVQHKAKLGVAARPKDAANQDSVDCCADNRKRVYVQKRRKHFCRLFGKLCHLEQKGLAGYKSRRSDYARKNRALYKAARAALGLFVLARSDFLSNQNRSAVSHSKANDCGQVSQDVDQGICRDQVRAKVAHNDGVACKARAPNDFVSNRRKRILYKVAQQKRVAPKKTFRPYFYFFGTVNHKDA